MAFTLHLHCTVNRFKTLGQGSALRRGSCHIFDELQRVVHANVNLCVCTVHVESMVKPAWHLDLITTIPTSSSSTFHPLSRWTT